MSRPPEAPDPQLNQRLAALLEHPDDPEFAVVAEALCGAGRAREAEQVCRAGLQHFPEDTRGRRTLGRALLLRGNLQEAQTQLLAVIKEDRQDAEAMLVLAEVLLQKSDPGRARTMLLHAGTILGPEDPRVVRMRDFLGEVTGEIVPLKKGSPTRKPLGPLIGGKGAILNVEDDSVTDLEAPEKAVSLRHASAGPAAKWAWIALSALVVAVFGFTAFQMSRTAGRVEAAVKVARKATRTGSLADYRAAHAQLRKAMEADPTNPDVRAWLAKIEARMALEFLVDVARVPAAIYGAEKIHRSLQKEPPGWFRKIQVRLGLAYRTPSWGQEQVVEARAIQQLLQGVQPRPGSASIRGRTVALLDAGLKASPGALDLRYVRGLAHLANGSPAKAQADLEAVLAKASDHVPAQLALASLHLEQGNVVDAQERFNRVVGVNPRSARARLGLVLSRLVRGRELAQATRDLHAIQAGEDAPRLVRGWYGLAQAWLYFGRGQLKEAYGAYKDAGRSVMPDPYWLSWYIRLGLLLGDVDRARRPLESGLAVLRSPADPLVQAFRLEVELMEGLAEQVARKAAVLGKTLPKDGVAAKRLGLLVARARLALGDHAGAAKGFAALSKVEPEAADRSFIAAYGLLAAGLAARPDARSPGGKTKSEREAAPGGKKTSVRGTPPARAGKGGPAPAAAGGAPTLAATEAALKALDKGAARPVVAYVRGRLAGTPALARVALKGARRYHRDAAAAGALLARLQITAGEVAKGQRTLNAAFALAPAYYPALRTRARLRHALGRGTAALDDLTALCYAGVRVELPRGLVARLQHAARWGAQLARLDRRTLCPSSLARPEDLYLRAELYIEQDRPAAVDLARLYIALGRSAGGDALTAGILDARTWLVGGPPPAQVKRAVEALEALAKTMGDGTRGSAAYYAALGAAHQAAADVKGAAEAYRKATTLRPSNVAWWTALGWVELARKEQGAAVTAFRRALAEALRQEADPVRVRARLQFALGKALTAAGKARDLGAAQKAFAEAVRLDPQLFQAAVELARLALAQKQPAAARKQLDEILRYDAGHPDALLLYLRLLPGGSAADQQRIPALTARLVKTARLDIQEGNLADGRFWLEEILGKVRKDHPGASLALAELLARTKTGKARAQTLLEAVQKNGSDAEKQQAAALLKSLR